MEKASPRLQSENRVAALDGLRGVAIALVLVGHLIRNLPLNGAVAVVAIPFQNPDLGVQVFFVLSGYLITNFMLLERSKTGSINLRRFYLRRTLRIWPAYYVFLVSIAALSLFGLVRVDGWSMAGAASFTWAYLPATSQWLAHAWSLSVEEQFYLLWPFLLRRLNNRTAIRVALVIIAVEPAVRVATYLIVPDTGVFMFFHARADSLLTGCILALVAHSAPTTFARCRDIVRRYHLALAAVVVLIGSCYVGEWVHGPWTLTVGWSVNSLAIATLLICATDAPNPTRSTLEWPPLVRLGVISFSVYLWQQLFTIPENHRLHALPAVAIAASLVAGYLSYQLVEKPFLTLKKRFAAPATPINLDRPSDRWPRVDTVNVPGAQPHQALLRNDPNHDRVDGLRQNGVV